MANIDNFKYASECLSCPTKPCQKGCPLGNDITDFIKEIKNNEYKKAFDILSETTVLMPICGRICPHNEQCQGSCVKKRMGKSVEIGILESTIGDMALKENWKIEVPKKTNHKVAVIGGGPSGLTCAAFLRKKGIAVTIYEKYNYLGGLLVHGIPEFRLSKKLVKQVTDNIINLGIDVKYNMELGKNLNLEDLKEEYDAIYLAIGANLSNKMNIPGENLKNVYGGNELLENNIKLDYEGKTVIVSGGGNVAMDVARTVKRSGAEKVIIVYRRSENEMPADIKEIEDAKKDGVEILYLTNIVKITGAERVEEIEVVKTKLVKKEGETRLSPVNIDGSNYTIPCDYVMMAVGSHPEAFVEELKLDKNRGRIAIDEEGRTSDEKVFSGGDIAGTKATVAWAARAGRNAANAIEKYINI